MTSGIVLATGDLAPDREDPDSCFAATSAALNAAELVFGQLETSFATRGTRLPPARHAVLAQPACAAALARAGFDVLSFAGNHCLDWGNDAFFETLSHLESSGIAVVGAGADIAAARRPVIRKLADGTRVAFLAYSSILPQAYWAEASRPGCAPMRAHTLYEQIEHDQPGTPARIHTWAHAGDLAAMQADIQAARSVADVVLVSHHWGIHFVRSVIADYQREVARAAISAGADAVLGHHAHILKGIETIEGRPVFYSLCNFATDLRMTPEHAARPSFREIQKLGENWEPDFASLYNFPPASRLSMIARLHIADGRIREVGFLPLHIDRDAVPRPVAASDPRFGAVVEYLDSVTREAGLNGRYTIHGDRVVVEPAS
jgi:poly-gamma-glutamate capsule biosynthesis protein CapA/YwtB (metallophosphatase superfamily)